MKKVPADIDFDIAALPDGSTIIPPTLRGRGRPKTFVAFSIGDKNAN